MTLEPYPDGLREAVVRYNRPMLRGVITQINGRPAAIASIRAS